MERKVAGHLLGIGEGAPVDQIWAAYVAKVEEKRKQVNKEFAKRPPRSKKKELADEFERTVAELKQAREVLLELLPTPPVPPPTPPVAPPTPPEPLPTPPVPPLTPPGPSPTLPEPPPTPPEPPPTPPEPPPTPPQPSPTLPEPIPFLLEPTPFLPEPTPLGPELPPGQPKPRPLQPEPNSLKPQVTFIRKRSLLVAVALLIALFTLGIVVICYLTQPKTGKLVLNTDPPGADVSLDGIVRGKTPVVLENIIPGDRQLKIDLDGYESEQLIVSVKPGDGGFTPLFRLVPVRTPVPAATSSTTNRPTLQIVIPAFRLRKRIRPSPANYTR